MTIIQKIGYLNIVTGFIFLVLLVQIVKYKKACAYVRQENEAAAGTLNFLQEENALILENPKGKRGELAVEQLLVKLCSGLNIQYRTHKQAGFNDAILSPQGNDPFSKEIDIVLVCEIGIICVEVKNWKGTWERDPNNARMLKAAVDGQTLTRPDPLFKTSQKTELVARNAAKEVRRISLVVFADPDGKVGLSLPENYLHIDELPYYFRREMAHIKETPDFDIHDAYDQVFNVLDRSKSAKHDHMMRLSADNENVKTYQANFARIQTLLRRPILGLPDSTTLLKAGAAFVIMSFINAGLKTYGFI